MAVFSLSSLLLLASPALAAQGLASWSGLAGAQVQSRVFLTGGLLTWGNWSDDGSGFGSGKLDQQSLTGALYEVDLEQSIDVNKDDVDQYLLKSNESMNTANYPGYAWGGLFHTKYTWFTFGGSALQKVTHPEVSTVTRGREFSQGAGAFSVSVTPNQPLDLSVSNFSDYITAGSYVSSPDQGLGWWFGGLTSSDLSAPLEYSPSDTGRTASVTSRLFIEATMPLDGSDSIQFTYRDVPTWLAGRTESSLVWLPYGEKGILLLMGGINRPALILTEATNSTNDNTYMTELAIYDIAAAQWYNQKTLETTEQPPMTADFCTAVVATEDGKGHEIFIYGGYDGTYTNANVYDDVWVLSLPAFQWTKVYDGNKTPTHGRQGSVCIAPNPTTLMSIGGTSIYGVPLTSANGLDMFDLNTLNWTGTYDSSANDTLQLPSAVVSQLSSLGYSASGPGTNAQIQGVSSDVSSLLATPYQQNVETYYPYTTTSPAPSGSASPTATPTPNNHAALIGGLVGGIGGVIVIAIIAFFCLKKHRKNKEGAERTKESRGIVGKWRKNIDPPTDKSHTSEETAVNPEYTHDKQPISELYEVPGSGPTTPGWGTYASGQRSPQVLSGSMATSPFMGSAEVDAQSRHEIMDHQPRDGQSLRQHHMYPRSFSGDQVMSVRSDSISHASTSVMPSRHYGYVSPYELPQDRSREDLAAPPADVNLNAPRTDADPNGSTHSLGLGAEHVHSPVALMPVAPFNRKPVAPVGADDNRPRHQRNQSSMSSDVPNLPSPGPEEDRRRSRLIDTLPDPKTAQNSPIQPQAAKKSVFKENPDS